MPTTPVYAIPYLALTDAPDIAALGEGIAEATEAELARIDGVLAGLLSSAVVATAQPTSNTSYVDLATVGPAATVTIGSSGMALVILTCHSANSTALWTNHMSYAVSGATSLSASDTWARIHQSEVAGGQGRASVGHLHTGLTPGSTTFTAKYKVTGGSGTFKDRSLIVVKL